MTKEELEEELEKEAEESSNKVFCIAHTYEDELIYRNGYLAGAESREKRINELKEQIEKMKRCSNCENGKGNCEYRTIFTTVCDKWQLRR